MTTDTVDAAAAGTWQLGDLTVNRIGFGAMRLTANADGSPSDRHRAVAVLRRAVELGVNHIDTAAFYFSPLRSANELINRALSPYPQDLVIVAKVGPGKDPSGQWLPMARPDQLRGQVEENLRQLGRDHLDVVYLRVFGPEPLAEHFGALAELRDAGLIRHLGVSAVRAHQVTEARTIAPVVCVSNSYGLGYRASNDALIHDCAAHGTAFVPFFSLVTNGREAGATGAEHDEVRAVAREHGVSAAQVRLAWTLSRGPNVLAIPGTGNPDHLVQNVAAGALRLSPEDLARLDAVHRAAAGQPAG